MDETSFHPVNRPDEHAAIESPSLDKSKRHATDARLRAAGFTLHSRPEGKEAVWTKGGRQYFESIALRTIR